MNSEIPTNIIIQKNTLSPNFKLSEEPKANEHELEPSSIQEITIKAPIKKRKPLPKPSRPILPFTVQLWRNETENGLV